MTDKPPMPSDVREAVEALKYHGRIVGEDSHFEYIAFLIGTINRDRHYNNIETLIREVEDKYKC